MNKKVKGILLYSGGLDSLLAAKVLMEQDIDLIGFHCVLPFVAPDYDFAKLEASQLAEQIHLPLKYYRCGMEYIEILKDPPHGYGKNMNPCVDCKIHFILKAADYMREIGADFVATGEVVGQRPMSQLKHTINHIEKSTHLQGRLVRPLSAKLLKPTMPEMEGIINREALLDINGRSRKRQFELARQYNINEYASPSGGCLLTDKNIAVRLRDLFTFHEDADDIDVYHLTIGRHFRIHDKAKVIVSRNEPETNELVKYFSRADYFFKSTFKGPALIIKGALKSKEIPFVCSILVRYGKNITSADHIEIFNKGSRIDTISVMSPIEDSDLQQYLIQ